MQIVYFGLLALLTLSFLGSFFVALVNYIQMLRHPLPGQEGKPLYHPIWWMPSRVKTMIAPDGLVHYRRMLFAAAFGMVVGFAVIVLSVLRVSLM